MQITEVSDHAPDNSETSSEIPQTSADFRTVPKDAEEFGKVPQVAERKENHTLTVRETARMFETAGVARTERSIINWCQPNRQGIARLDSYYDPNERKYFITPQSVETAIQEEIQRAKKSTEVPDSESFGSHVEPVKYQQHLPIYRQQAELAENHGIELSRKTLTDAVLAAGSLLQAVVRAQQRELLAGNYLQADETPLPCQTPEKTGRNHRAYLWEYSVPGGVVVFDFQMGRSRAGPKEFLKGFRGTLQCDGYSAYADLGPGIVYAGCLAHARRGFVEAAKVAPLDPLPPEVVAQFGELYALEKTARTAGLDPAQRLALRQQKSVPLMAALKERLVTIRQQIAPGGALAKACDYTLSQWSRLEVYLADGRIEADNNWCEGGLRAIVLGRKNWLHVGGEQAGPKVAAIASIVETCRRLDINLRQYLNDVLPRLGQWPINRVAELTPTAWQAAHKKS